MSKNVKDYYTCPMHPEIKSEAPGNCPKCGGMELVRNSELSSDDSKHSHHHHHDHSSMMASPEAASDFLKRFFIVTVLLVPLLLFSNLGVRYLGFPDFSFRHILEFGIASIIFYFGLVFFEHAKHEIASRQYGMMTLVSLGVGSGYLFSAVSTFFPSMGVEFYLEVATLIWVLLFGHYLEAKSSTAAGDALQEVAKLLPKKAHLIGAKGDTKDVDITDLKEGDVVLVKPGEKVPADGEIIKGSGDFNESHLTGESKPVSKNVGSTVVAGSISINGSIEVRLTRVGEFSTIGQIQKLISSAKQTKPSAQKLADKASKWLTFTALGVSLLTLLTWTLVVGEPFVFSVTLAITVLVIACPHALGLAIPTVSTIATKLAVNNGVFIKDMSKIEIIRKADYVVFDKTGTLTKGEFGVEELEILQGSKEDLLAVLGGIESHSTHFIALALQKYAEEQHISFARVENIKDVAGMGITGVVDGKKYLVGNVRLMEKEQVMSRNVEEVVARFSKNGYTIVLIADEQRVLGVVGLSDGIKEEAYEVIEGLHELGIKVAMLTGDTEEASLPVAEKLGIDSVFSEVLPEDKYEHIKGLQDEEHVVLMVGDGVNDAPALTQADVGVAIGAGTDVAAESGDVILTQSNPNHVVKLVILSKRVYRKMKENLFWALGYNVVALPAAAGLFIPLGFKLTPAFGALLMSLSSVIVVLNAFTLRKAKLDL